MRLICQPVWALAFAACLALPPGMAGAKFVCGNFDGTFTCKRESGAPKVKGAIPAAKPAPSAPETGTQEATTAPGTWSGETSPSGAPAPDGTACQGGMVGTPPDCRCPPNSELLGGNCVRYTASTCTNALAPDALPQACRGVEEKLSCRMREDGLKDCCCVIYDKF
jgi:hypothetical protein